MPTPRVLPRAFYARPALDVARDLVGKFLVRRDEQGLVRAGRIVETEAYVGPEDLACHAAKGLTPRTRVMYGPPGRVYVFLIYGMHHCFNVVCEREGFPAAVLVRALEPAEGFADGKETASGKLLNGPGKLCAALGITRAHNDFDLLRGGELSLETRKSPEPRIVATPRIGVDYAGPWAAEPFRFVDAKSLALSKKLPAKLP